MQLYKRLIFLSECIMLRDGLMFLSDCFIANGISAVIAVMLV